MGAGGTGKTAVLKITEALTTFFAGANVVQKLAPSNAAARLLGGDTIHAMLKLPFGKATLSSKKGRLNKGTLSIHRKKWAASIAVYLDEISMVSADQFLQMDVRMRQAKNANAVLFGGLAVNICGDFLQLPPVDKFGTRKSLAKPLDDAGYVEPDSTEESEDENINQEPDKKRAKQEALVEGRQGFMLWRGLRRVVCLSVNVRAPDALGQLQAEMRAGCLSDAMWNMYMSRVMVPGDSRLTDPSSPFAKHDIHFIVHRHKIRVMRSMDNAQDESRRLRTPLYIVQAWDEAVEAEDKPKLTDLIRSELLSRVNPEETKGLPSFLPLYCGMRLLLSSKDCVRFGIMKGCPVILRSIVFADHEVLPLNHVAGQPFHLQFMPVSLVLQVEKADWELPHTELPSDLPKGINRRGLFQIRPRYDYLPSVKIEDSPVSIRRTSFLVTPADTVTVYAAQGSTYDAVVADMERPPNWSLGQHWLACYVMISRARGINGLLVLRPAKRSELSAGPPSYLLEELQRLMLMETASHQELVDYIGSLSMSVSEKIQGVLDFDAPAKEAERVKHGRGSCQLPDPLSIPTVRLRSKTMLDAAGRSSTCYANSRNTESKCIDSKGSEQHVDQPVPDASAILTPLMAVGAISIGLSLSHMTGSTDENTDKQTDLVEPTASDTVPVERPSSTCTSDYHICNVDWNNGCTACGRTCHTDCESILCEFEPCGLCLSNNVATPENSTVCIEMQRYRTCHACGIVNCWQTSDMCVFSLQNVIDHDHTTPRGFYNAGNSCFINAAIQALFGSVVIRTTLCNLWRSLSGPEREVLKKITTTNIHTYNNRHDELLAGTLWAAYSKTAADPFLPIGLLRKFYHGVQEDVGEFLLKLIDLNTCPSLWFVTSGCQEEFLSCPDSHRHLIRAEDFGVLSLPVLKHGGRVVRSVQEALNEYTLPEAVYVTKPCSEVGCHQANHFMKSQILNRAPKVLVLYLVRMRGREDFVSNEIFNPIEANVDLNWYGRHFKLCAVVSHLGSLEDSNGGVTNTGTRLVFLLIKSVSSILLEPLFVTSSF